MTPEQVAILDTLLREDPKGFEKDQQQFLVMLAKKLRHTILSRIESMALEAIGFDHIEGRLPEKSPGAVNSWGHHDVTPEPNQGYIGGPGGKRPPGTGDGLSPFCEPSEFRAGSTFCARDQKPSGLRAGTTFCARDQKPSDLPADTNFCARDQKGGVR